MAESSAKGAAELSRSGGRPTSSSAAIGKRPHLSQRFKSFRKKHFNPASSKTSSTSGLNASLSAEKDGDDKRSEYKLASTGLPSRKRPESSTGAGTGPSLIQASYPTPRNENASAAAGRDCDLAVPIAELWNQAYEQLREKEPKLIEKYEEEISRHVSTMVAATVQISGLGKVRRREQMEVLVKQKLKEDEDGKWRIPLGNDPIAIRDLAGYVVSIVDWGKEFVGTALESSPYGSIAWTGVCLLLPLILNPSKQRASNISGLEYISDLLSRCTMYEHAYHQRFEINRDGSSSEADLACGGYKSALNELYIRILEFQARSVCQLSRNPVSGGIRAVFKIDDWDSLLEDIKLQEASCQTFFNSVKDQAALDAREEGHKQRTSLLLDKLGELNLGIKGIRDKLDEIHVTDEESKCFETLRTSNYLARKDLNPERLSGTCNWFFDHPKYQGWIGHTSTSRLLWVSANPGCGKSVLAKALVDRYDRGSVCYYFFKDDTVITRSAAHAVCALLHQICDLRPDLIRYVLPKHRKNGQRLVDSFEDLWSIFADITSDKDFGTVICILDAIDECSEDDQKKLLQRLAAISISSTSIKVLITSRPYKSIEAALFHETGLDKNEIRLSGEARTEESLIEKEIDIFIKSKVQAFQKLRESNDIFDNIHEKLQSHLDGVENRTYLWASAVFNELEKETDAPDYILMDIIKTLPENVDKAYENILNKSPNSKKPILLKVLHIMLASFEPLSLMEMNAALSVQDTSSGLQCSGLHPESSFGKWLRDLCGFFVNIVDNELYFAHQTARDFLLERDGNQAAVGWKGSFQMASSHTLLAQICIDYLLLLYDGLLNDSFESYATSYWPRHCQSLDVDQSLAEKVKFFLFQNRSVAPSFVRWTETSGYSLGYSLDYSLDYHRVSEDYFSNFYSNNPRPTPLFLACYFGWSSVVLFMKTFSDIDWNKKNKFGWTGLHIAVREGHSEVAKLLLNAGADINFQEGNETTALHLAASRGHLEIAKLSLDAGFDVNLRGQDGETALHLAAVHGCIETVELLFAAEADVNIQDYLGGTALYYATFHEQLEIVKLLLDAGADVNFQDHGGETALHRAASEGNLAIVKSLLTVEADVNLRGRYGESALHRAASQGHLEIVKLLLTAGADVNMESDNESPLYIAEEHNHIKIAETLRAAGAVDSSYLKSRIESRCRSGSVDVNLSGTELSVRDAVSGAVFDSVSDAVFDSVSDAVSDSVSDSESAPYILRSKDFEFGDGDATGTQTTDST